MRFLPPRPSSAGSMAASPAPAGGGLGLFRAYSAQRNCLLLGWANSRAQNKRKCSEEVSRPKHRQREPVEPPRAAPSFRGLAEGVWACALKPHRPALTCTLPLAGSVVRFSTWCCWAEKGQVSLLPGCQVHSPTAQLPTSLSAVQNWQWLPKPVQGRLHGLSQRVNPPTPRCLLLWHKDGRHCMCQDRVQVVDNCSVISLHTCCLPSSGIGEWLTHSKLSWK